MSTHSELETILGAIRFFTRLPIPGTLGQDPAVLAKAMRYFPVVGGLFVGAPAALVFGLVMSFWPKTLATLIAMLTAILVTGALHEDGWADTIDGLGGGRDPETVLSIMRDSRIGSFGALALTLMLMARFFTLSGIETLQVPIALVVGHMASRLCAVGVFQALDYARAEGKASPFTDKLGRGNLIFLTVTTLLLALLLEHAIPALLFAAGATYFLYHLFKRRIGGYTGDCLGAVQQLAEVAFYGGLLCQFS
jgi:adenosylcobinamide-GDP ribazoletransferase